MQKLHKEKRALKISSGLLVGYLLAGMANMLIFDKTWKEAFSERALAFGFIGIAISILITDRLKYRKKTTEGFPFIIY